MSARQLRAAGVIAAGGSLAEPDTTRAPRLARRLWLFIELLVFYVGAPLLVITAVYAYNVPLFLALQPILFGFIAYLLWDDTFSIRRELSVMVRWTTVLSISAVFAVVTAAVGFVTWRYYPGLFLAFPTHRPELWAFVMLAYPLMSVVPQELVYRTFFFHRYGPLFGEARWAAIVLNGALFGFAHIIFGNWFAVISTGLIGVLFAYRYERTRSFQAIWLEHALYGCMIFTIGLGRWFFTGVSNLN